MQKENERKNYAQNGYNPYGTLYSKTSYIYYYLSRNYPFT